MTMDEPDEGLLVTAKDNSNALKSALCKDLPMEDFLTNEDLQLAVHSSNTTPLENDILIHKSYDIDGVVIELKSLAALISPIHYLTINVKGIKAAYPIYNVLKKHLRLSDYTAQGIKCLKNAHACTVGYTDGWRVSVALVPTETNGCPTWNTWTFAKHHTLELFTKVRDNFVNLLKNLKGRDNKRPSILKNSLQDVTYMNILRKDQHFILSLLDQALVMADTTSESKWVVIAAKFGQKEENELVLSEIVDTRDIVSVSVHSACNLNASQYNINLLWSRQGLQQVIGSRGKLFPCLSLAEAANFQTNVDSRTIDITSTLRDVALYPTGLTFLQMYAETPHRHYQSTTAHPCSGLVTCCGLLHPKTTGALIARRDEYIANMEDNISKLTYTIPCRMEIVTKLEGAQIKDTIGASQLFNESGIDRLLEKSSILLPFYEEMGTDNTFVENMRGIAQFICTNLKNLTARNEHKGGFLAAWKVYQLELALEIFLWGHPIRSIDNIYCTNLGVGMVNERSLSLRRGILGLEPANSSASPDTPPPLSNWTSSNTEWNRIFRIFTFSDCLEAGDVVVGHRLVHIALLDLYDSKLLYLHHLQKNTPPPGGQCIGSITIEQLVTTLSNTNAFKYPYTFGRATQILLNLSNRSLKTVLIEGIKELELQYFPAMRVFDEARNVKISWNGRAFHNIMFAGTHESEYSKAASISGDVRVVLDRKRLTYERNIKCLQEEGMPWMVPALRRLQGEDYTDAQLVQICTFVTCVALIQSGIYVDYNILSNLVLDMPITQQRLKELQIQSHLVIPGINRPKLWKLHANVPYRIEAPTKETLKGKINPNAADQEQRAEMEVEVFEEHDPDVVTSLKAHHLPARWNRSWSDEEQVLLQQSVDFLQESGVDIKPRYVYDQYVKRCKEAAIPTRTFRSVRHRLESDRTSTK